MDDVLAAAIRAAFPIGAPPARPVTGHRCVECDDIDHHLGGRTWRDVESQILPMFSDAFCLLTPAAKVYYLPAYMCFEARSQEYEAGPSVSAALESGELAPASFTAAQRAAVWAWAEAYYRTQYPDGFPPDSVAEAWWLGEG